MVELLLKSLPMFLAPAPIAGLRRYRVSMRPRGGFSLRRMCRRTIACTSGLELIYSTENSDGSVVFRFGTATEVEEYVASQEVLNGNGEVETEEVAEVGDSVQEEHIVGDDTGDKMVALNYRGLGMDPPAGDVENVLDCSLHSSDFMRGEQINIDFVGVSDVSYPAMNSNVLVEDHEDNDGNSETRNLAVAEDGSRSRYDSNFVSGFVKELSTFEYSTDFDGYLKCSLEEEIITSKSSNVIEKNSECILENVNIENSSSSADDVGGNMGKESDEKSEGDVDKEFDILKSIISDEDSDSYGGDQSTTENDNLDPISLELEPDATDSSPIKEGSLYIDVEDISLVVSDVSINAKDAISNPETNTVLIATADASQYYSDSNGHMGTSITEKARIINKDFESDDKEIGVVNGTLASDKDVTHDDNTKCVVFEKTNLSEVNQNEDAQDAISLDINSLDTDYVVNQPFVDENLNQERNFHISDDTQTEDKATSTTKATEVAEVDILSSSATTILISEATEGTPAKLVVDREKALPVRFCLSLGAALLPQSSEALTGGEDAYFIAGEAWFGVADGVGQWSLEGIDDGLYAHEIMENCRRIVSNRSCLSSTNPKEVLCRSAAEATLPGLATVLVAYFDGQVLHVSNIGDTGFVIVRNGVVSSRSSPTVHNFHFPCQIKKGDDPLEFVECYAIELNEGDIIVAATDGLFDNLYDQDIAAIITESLQANLSPKDIAAVLAVKAQETGQLIATRSPFADAAQAAGYPCYTGGKLDDVAVIVSVVQKKS